MQLLFLELFSRLVIIMAGGNPGLSFIVATGDPEKGRGYRLSQARSLAAKRQHQSRSQRRKPRLTSPESIDPNLAALEGALKHIPRELNLLITPPPLSSLPVGYKRMQDCKFFWVRSSYVPDIEFSGSLLLGLFSY